MQSISEFKRVKASVAQSEVEEDEPLVSCSRQALKVTMSCILAPGLGSRRARAQLSLFGGFGELLQGPPPGHTRSKKLRGAKGIATRSKDATRGSWPYY